jgi:ATP-dependent Lhr-like helicase
VWRGLVTSDGAGALRGRARLARSAAPRRRRTAAPPAGVGVVGRFSLTETLVQGRSLPSPTERALAVAEQLLWACGVLDNEQVSTLSRGLAPANDVKAALRAMEDQGAIRRGYFVDGAAGLQYGTPAAVESLRAQRAAAADDDGVFVVSAIDPAQPFGADVPWPAPTSPRGPDCASPQRSASSLGIIAAGRLVGLVVAGGRKILTFFADTEPERSRQARALARGLAWLAATRLRDGRGTRLIVADVDGLDAAGPAFSAHPLCEALPTAGFVKSAGGWIWPLPRQPVGPGPSSSSVPSPPASVDGDTDAMGADAFGADGEPDDDDGGFDVI